MRIPKAPGAALALMISAFTSEAQTPTERDGADTIEIAFRERVKAGTAKFASRDAAVRAGYRAVGGDFPAMGRHWVHPGVILRGRVEPENPAILTYAEIEGVPVLVGVAFAIPLAPGENPPPIAGREREWHQHNGSVAEESLVGEHHHAAVHARRRLAILHAWTGVENPDGLFATDNWALPFVRAGISVPPNIRPAAARAIALLSGGEEYYLMLIGTSRGGEAELRRSMDAGKREVVGIVRRPGSSTTLTMEQLEALETVWHRLVATLEEVAGDSVRPLRVAVRRR